MGLLSWLFGKKDDAPMSRHSARLAQQSNARAVVKWRDGSFPMEVVGESHYQRALSSICGPHTRDGHDHECTAVIELEPSNPHDQNAMAVRIQNRIVGYLPRDQAARVATQMRDEGISSANCRARVRGGWRTNQYDEGNFGVRLSIPQTGWIDFGIGRAPPVKQARPKPKNAVKPQRPEPADNGPLLGERVTIIGAPSNGELAMNLAKHGAYIMAGFGKTTTMLVVVEDRPFTPGLLRSANYEKAKEQIDQGAPLRILSLSEIRQLLGEGVQNS